MEWSPGRRVVRRCLHPDGRLAYVEAARVVSDDARGLLLWVGGGSTVMRRVSLGGEPTRSMAYADELSTPTTLRPVPYGRFGKLVLTPPDCSHSVWWWFSGPGVHEGWYVNFEASATRWESGIDLFDLALDVVVRPDLSWSWKDEDAFAAQTGHPLFWSASEASAIRARAEAVVLTIAPGAFPFDGTWCDFVPPASWGTTSLPPWWDLPSSVPAHATWSSEELR